MSNDDVWFEPKRFGYGAGLPVAWQGWALIGGYMMAVFGLMALLGERHRALFVALVIVLTLPLLVVSVRHTRGGWRWRWGGE